MKKIFYLIALLSILCTASYGQQLDRNFYDNLNSLIQQKYGTIYELDFYSPMNPKTHDPYGTLKDCILFTASGTTLEEANYYFGIYKSGQIIWESNKIENCFGIIAARTIGSFDINKDGVVEIFFTLDGGQKFAFISLYIYSWDGMSGKLISQLDEDGVSVINTVNTSEFEFLDINGDGIFEIQGYDVEYIDEENQPENEAPNVTITEHNYSWNGMEFGIWSDTPVTDENTIYPRNKVTVEIACDVTKIKTDDFKYKYKIYNNPSSIQKMDGFILTQISGSIKSVTKRERWEFWDFLENEMIYWDAFDAVNLIIQGERDDTSFSFIANKLPSIVNYHILGNNYRDKAIETNEKVLANSISGKTIGPAELPNPFIAKDFIDTILTYNTESYNLGWVKEEVVYNRIDRMLKGMKRKLPSGGGIEFEDFFEYLESVNRSNKITSEAYALLKYNMKYLKSKVQPGGDD